MSHFCNEISSQMKREKLWLLSYGSGLLTKTFSWRILQRCGQVWKFTRYQCASGRRPSSEPLPIRECRHVGGKALVNWEWKFDLLTSTQCLEVWLQQWPLWWWTMRCQLYYRFVKGVRECLSIPIAQVACTWLFSPSECVVTIQVTPTSIGQNNVAYASICQVPWYERMSVNPSCSSSQQVAVFYQRMHGNYTSYCYKFGTKRCCQTCEVLYLWPIYCCFMIPDSID